MIAVMVVIIVVTMCLLVPVVMFRTNPFMYQTLQHGLTERKRPLSHCHGMLMASTVMRYRTSTLGAPTPRREICCSIYTLPPPP